MLLLAEALAPGVRLGGSRLGTLEDTVGACDNGGGRGELSAVDIAASREGERDLCARVGTPTSTEVANHLGGAWATSGAGRLQAGRLATKLPVSLECGRVSFKDLGDIVPPAGAQRLVGSDGDECAIRLSGTVLEVPIRRTASGVPRVGEVHVCDVGLRVKHVPGLGVDLVDTETGVEVRVCRGRGSDP